MPAKLEMFNEYEDSSLDAKTLVVVTAMAEVATLVAVTAMAEAITPVVVAEAVTMVEVVKDQMLEVGLLEVEEGTIVALLHDRV